MKRPAFQFYPSDWRKDMALQSCSVTARGLWIELLCIAHECEPYGHLMVGGRPMSAAQIGRHTGLTEREAAKLLTELLDAGVASKTDGGAMYSRRMVRDEDLRKRRAAGGEAGSAHGIKGAEHGRKGGRPNKGRGVSEPPLEPPPSSSSSSSSSTTSPLPSVEEIGPAAPAQARKRARPSPSGCLDAEALVAAGVDPQHAADWLSVRRAKALPLTATAWADTRAEAAKAGVTVAEAVRMAAAHGWGGFRAAWVAGADAQRGALPPRQSANAAEAAKWAKHLGLDRPRSAEIIDMEAINAARPALG